MQAFNKRIEAGAASVRSFVAGFTGLAGVSFAFMDIAQKSIQFEKSLSSLRSLTGLSAKDMEFFKQKAIELGSTSTQTASQVVEAFQLIGSQQPELLKNKEALAEVTKQAIILAEAAGMDVPEAAKALSGSINQMGESADVAGEYINILAAASQAGSADIQYLAKAIEKSGGAASSVGVKYNELVAAIEAIAPKITEASEAGTNLRNIFLTLESSSDKNLKPSVVGLTKALDNLAAKNLDATQMTKMFGKESVTAALAIVNAKEDYKKYIEAITGTNTALEQQRINNDNLAGSLNNISSAWEGFVLTLNKSNGVLKETTDYLGKFIMQATELLKSEEQKQTEILAQGVTDRRKELDREIEGWMVLGDKRKAIEETIRQFNQRNPSEPVSKEELNTAKNKLEEITKIYKDIKDRANKGFPATKESLEKAEELGAGRGSEITLRNLKKAVEYHQNELYKLEAKNNLYKESVRYLDEQLDALDQIDKKTKETSANTAVTDDMRKKWKKESIKIKAEYELDSSIESSVKRQIAKIQKDAGQYEIKAPIHFEFFPTDFEAELPDLTGSITGYQKRIHDITIAYNEATNNDLRKLYAEQIKDLEDQIKKMEKTAKTAAMDLEPLLKSALGSAATSGFEAIGEALAAGDPTEALRDMLASLMDILKQFGSALVALGVAELALEASLSNPYAAIAAGGALIVAAAVAKAALQKVAKPMANGGIVYGETFARVGEYPGAASNPEVVAPLNKLKDIIEPKSSRYEEIHITGELIGRGSNLVAVVDNYSRKQGRMR